MIKLFKLHEKLKAINARQRLVYVLYLYNDSIYCTVYGIMGPYKNYPNHLYTPTQEKFNKIIVRLRIEIDHNFAIYQNL